MTAMNGAAAYRRRGAQGTLSLRGVVDIFEAGVLHAAVQQAASDRRVETIRVNLAEVERLDLSAVQLLAALRAHVEQDSRALVAENVPASVEGMLERINIAL